MKTRLILKAGQSGTKRLVKKYGDSLLCVRFKYDAETRQRLKTVELIVERNDWTPPAPRYSFNSLVYLRIAATDLPMRSQAKEAGARWDPEKRLWSAKYGNIAGTGLESYIYVDRS